MPNERIGAESRPSSRWRVVLPWIAPALLGAIALTQFAYAHFASLSPWKGGGFGMFSTVDSPGARFLRIYLVTPRGEIPALVPENWRETALQLRTTGSEAMTAKLAEELARGTWVKLRMASAVQYYHYLLQKHTSPDIHRELTAELRLDSPVTSPPPRELDFVRMLASKETPGPSDKVLDVTAVRVELWRYAFDRPTTSLNASRLFEVTSPRSGQVQS